MHFAKTRPCEPYSFIIAHGKGMLFRVYPTTDPGEDTEDMVFALSIEEAEMIRD